MGQIIVIKNAIAQIMGVIKITQVYISQDKHSIPAEIENKL